MSFGYNDEDTEQALSNPMEGMIFSQGFDYHFHVIKVRNDFIFVREMTIGCNQLIAYKSVEELKNMFEFKSPEMKGKYWVKFDGVSSNKDICNVREEELLEAINVRNNKCKKENGDETFAA